MVKGLIFMDSRDFKGFNSDELHILENLLSEYTFRQSQAIMKIQETRNLTYNEEDKELENKKHLLIKEQLHYWDILMTMLAFIEQERRSRSKE
jgi:hypothetical protein